LGRTDVRFLPVNVSMGVSQPDRNLNSYIFWGFSINFASMLSSSEEELLAFEQIITLLVSVPVVLSECEGALWFGRPQMT
jgi:hypothetical protein